MITPQRGDVVRRFSLTRGRAHTGVWLPTGSIRSHTHDDNTFLRVCARVCVSVSCVVVVVVLLWWLLLVVVGCCWLWWWLLLVVIVVVVVVVVVVLTVSYTMMSVHDRAQVHLIMGTVSLWTRLPALHLCAGP